MTKEEGKEKKEKKDKGEKEEKKEKKDKGKGKEGKSKEKVIQKIAALERKLATLKQSVEGEVKLQDKVQINYEGLDLRCDKDVRVRVGPVIGKVTSTSAVVLLEVTLTAEVVVHLIPEGGGAAAGVHSAKLLLPRNRPRAFLVEGLTPDTKYNVVFEGINAKDVRKRTGKVHTFPTTPHHLRVAAVSCDRPERLKPGETNMWEVLANQISAGEVDVVLHLGDQVYGQDEFVDAQAILRYANLSETPKNAEEQKELYRLHKSIKERMRDVYRYTWNLPFTQRALSQSSHLMIWSDNDLYNDFTIAKEDGKALEPIMIKLGQEVYREYQRQLWDPSYGEAGASTTDEYHYHKFGTVGILLIDMRGNRIDATGKQCAENVILNEGQWAVIDNALADPELKTFLVCSEIPFASDPPATAKKNSLKSGLEFMVDHWAYNDTELVKLFEKVFEWKHAGNRDAIFVAGDIHVGVDSIITDNKTGVKIQQLTATPISNHVCDFFPKLEEKVNDRFSFVHTPLKLCRNYGYIVASLTGDVGSITGKLIAGAPTHGDH